MGPAPETGSGPARVRFRHLAEARIASPACFRVCAVIAIRPAPTKLRVPQTDSQPFSPDGVLSSVGTRPADGSGRTDMAKGSSRLDRLQRTGTSRNLATSLSCAGRAARRNQVASSDVPVLTTQQGIPVADDQNSLKNRPARPDGARGLPFREKSSLRPRAHPGAGRPCARFGAHGYFENYDTLGRCHARRLVPAPRRKDSSFRAFLDRCWEQRVRPNLARDRAPASRSSSTQGRHLGPRRQQ